MNILIANIGNRDLWVRKDAPIPGEVNPQWNKDASRRALGRALQEAWPGCRPYLDLPIIGKAVNYARQQSGQLDRVILVSSDQSGEEGTAEHHLAQDTCELAVIVERLLVEQHGIKSGAVTHWTVRRNPADYGTMQTFYRQHLSSLRDEHPDATFYLEVSGGTPAMTSMLLTVGAEVLKLDARPLYVSEYEEQPFSLELGRRLVVDSLVRVLRQDVGIYAYYAAAQTVRDNLELLREFYPADVLLAILEHAHWRRNFCFEQAWAVAEGVTDPAWRERLLTIAEATRAPDRPALLRECILNARLAYHTQNLFDFVVRVFQFVEGVWRYLALQLGVQFEHNGKRNPDGKELAAAWIQEHAELIEGLKKDGVKFDTVNRYVLERLVNALQKDQERFTETIQWLKRLEQVGDLRNRVVHQHHHITLELLRDAFYPKKREQKLHPPKDAADIVQAMQTVWSTATGQPFDTAHPYAAVNDMIYALTDTP